MTSSPPDCWAPIFWEPVEATGERLTVGVVVRLHGKVSAHRIIRDDVLDCLYGKSAGNARRLIDTSLDMLRIVAEHGFSDVHSPMSGFFMGPPRFTEPKSIADALRVCALMHSSLANLDKLDDLATEDAPTPEETNRRFSTEIRAIVLESRPELEPDFNRPAVLLEGGEAVRFGFLAPPRAVLHFGVLHPVRQAASVRDARARLWELSRARDYAQIRKAALIYAVPRDDDPTLGGKQLDAIRRNRLEIEREADAVSMRAIPVTSVGEAAERVIEYAAQG